MRHQRRNRLRSHERRSAAKTARLAACPSCGASAQDTLRPPDAALHRPLAPWRRQAPALDRPRISSTGLWSIRKGRRTTPPRRTQGMPLGNTRADCPAFLSSSTALLTSNHSLSFAGTTDARWFPKVAGQTTRHPWMGDVVPLDNISRNNLLSLRLQKGNCVRTRQVEGCRKAAAFQVLGERRLKPGATFSG